MIEPVHRFRALRSTLWISIVKPRREVGTSTMDDGFEMKTSALRGNAFLVRGEASTIEALALLVEELLIEHLDSLSEEEAEALLSDETEYTLMKIKQRSD